MIRLAGSTISGTGRVEVLYNGIWGTVCDDDWDDLDAKVVCRQLGYSRGIAHGGAAFGSGNEPTWLDNVRCTGTELRLAHCLHAGWGREDCSHEEDAGVVCSGNGMESNTKYHVFMSMTSRLSTKS